MKNVFCSTLLLLLMATVDVYAQKLPNVQESSIYAPAGTKVNGDIIEWGRELQAYNRATEIWYTMGNDSLNLYLVVKATDHAVIQKIVAGGITLSIKPSDKKGNITPVAITYPLVPAPYDNGISYKLRTNDSLSQKMQADINKQVFSHIKEIRITGAPSVPDSAVSVYNELGIKAAGSISTSKIYTTELVVPLKYLKSVINNAGTFRYTITENGLDYHNTNITVVNGRSAFAPTENAVQHTSGNFLLAPTYFSGSYTLAKK